MLLLLLQLPPPSSTFSASFCSGTLCRLGESLCFACNYWHQDPVYDPTTPRPAPPAVHKAVETTNRASRSDSVSSASSSSVRRGDFPWSASLKYRSDREVFVHFCGGALVSPRHVASAASCLSGVGEEDVFVALGEHDREEEERGEALVAVTRVDRHPKFG